MFNKFFSSLIILTALLVFDGWGQILTFDFAGYAGNEASGTSNFNNSGLTSSTITRGTGLTAGSNADRFNATGFTTSATLDANDYFQFNVTPNSGKKFSVSSIEIKFQRSGTGPLKFALRSSQDSYASNLDGEKSGTDVTTTQTFTFTFSANDIASAVNFRLYCYSAEAGTGTGGPGDFTGDDIVVIGGVSDILASEPTTDATLGAFSAISQTGFTINWTSGNGTGRLVLVKQGGAVDANPVDATDYGVNSSFGSGDQLGTGNYAVYKGTGNSVAITGLTANTTYHVAVFEYNSSGTTINYRTTSPGTANQTTASAGPDPNVSFTGTDPGSAQIVVGTTKNIIYRTQLSVTGADVTMTDAGFTTSGNYTASDIQSGGFKLYYSTDATLDIGDIELGSISSLSDGTAGDLLLFTGFSRDFAVGSAYLFLTADVDAAATTLRTISTDTPGAADFTFTVTVTNTGSSFAAGSTHTFYKSPPTLTADNSSNTVDNNIDIAFSANAAWTAAITAVKIGGTGLTVTTDYEVINGMITLKPSGGNSLLTTAGSKLVTVEATGYTTASVTQQINAGAPTSNSTATISAALGLNTTRTVTVTAKDQYNNLVSGYTFKYDATITDATATTDESYTIDGTARTVTVTDINLTTVTDISGVATFTIALPSIVDANDGISVQVQLDNGTTNVGTAFSYIKQPVQVMISHLSVDYGAATDEFIVLFNNTNSDFDLNGYELQYFAASGGTGLKISFSTSTIILSKKYYLLASNATVTIGSVNVTRDNSFTSGMGTSGQLQLRQASTPSNILYAVAWGTITSYVAGMTDAATWSGDGMISLTPSGTTYVRNDYNTSNTQYSHTLAANIAFIPNSSDAPLPVELTSFTAKSTGNTVTLNWETKTEVDNNGFEVERNANGNWQKIGFVEGHGTANSPKYYSFIDNGAIGNKIQYRLRQNDNDGTFEYSPVVEVELNPTTFALYQNYPNPFNPSTMIRFSMPVSGNVALNVFNTLGEKVATLLNGQMEAGYHEVSFDAKNLPSGLYFYEIKTGDFSSIKKMILMK